MNHTVTRQVRQNKWQYGLLAILGLTFWFALGFPFENSNESYIWVAQLRQFSFVDAITRQVAPVATFRPLGIATAWLGYTLSGGSIYPQQVFNFVGAVLAWLILFFAIQEKALFGWVSFLVGGAFFSGYIYLFHLHGVFYSPLLVFLAILLAISVRNKGVQFRKLIILTVLTVLASLYHPYALALFVAFLPGYALEKRRALTRKQIIAGGLCLMVMLGLIRLLVPSQTFQPMTQVIQGFSTSFKAVELNIAVSLVSWLLSVVTVVSLKVSWQVKAIMVGVVSVALPIFLRFHQPFLFVWLFVSLVKTLAMKKWSLAVLILAAAVLPAVTATGSPTYVLPLLMVCSVVTALDSPYLETHSGWQNRVALAISILVVAVIVPLKLRVHLPVISGLVKPVLAEKEKTFQLEEVIRWYTASNYSQYRLALCQRADNPVESANAVDRTYRPPTSQYYLDAYLSSIRAGQSQSDAGQLLVCFGGEMIPNAGKLYVLTGQYSGDAIVFECSNPQPISCRAQQTQ